MTRLKLGVSLLVGAMAITASLDASASCGGYVSFPEVDYVYTYQAGEWVKANSDGVDPFYSLAGTIYNKSSSTASNVYFALDGSHHDGQFNDSLLAYGVWLTFWDENASYTSCTLNVYNPGWTWVVSDTVSTSCHRWLEAPSIPGFSVWASVKCSLAPKLTSPTRYAELMTVTEAQWNW